MVSKGRTRTIVLSIIFMLYVAAVITVVALRFPYAWEVLRLDEHIEEWKREPASGTLIPIPRILYDENGIETLDIIQMPSKGRTILELAIYAALEPVDSSLGLSSKTSGVDIISIHERDGRIMITLRGGDEEAYQQIASTIELSVQYSSIDFMTR